MTADRVFVIVGHTATTDPTFSLNDIPGSAGRMDILARCVNSAFFLSHGMRRDVITYLLLKGGERSVIVEMHGETLRNMNPDERNIASLIKIALKNVEEERGRYSTPGIFPYYGELSDIMEALVGRDIFYLHEEGYPGRSLEKGVYVLGDKEDLTEEEEAVVVGAGASKLSLGEKHYHADHCVTMVNFLIDRAD